METLTRSVRRILLFFFAFGVSIYAMQYLNFDTGTLILSQKGKEIVSQWPWQIGFYGHIIGGVLALSIGPFQFLKNFRHRNLKLHRGIGKIYVFAILAGSICAFYAAFYASEGLVAQTGFAALAIAWFFTTFRAYQAIRAKDLESHKRWMVRSYACTMAAVTLRIWLPLGTFGLHFSFHDMYRAVAWLCWVPNLLVAEWLINRRKFEL
ncbi:DUF2306 domain-containing protein [Runella sp.]|jgi:uncharacterized membrane protein|uniref:DUF2306 domain-containing protein n=1 Tax=Runella sp. TaxID=1960881 RepID=UPI00262CE085|nr:DUF2306 domain-containing protein [Runella sp.]